MDDLTARGLIATENGVKPSDDGPPTLSAAGMSRAIGREILRLAEENEREKRMDGFDRLGADRLADEVASLVARGLLDSRSSAADALLDYREPPRTERSDRLANLEAERDRLAEEVERLRVAADAARNECAQIRRGLLEALDGMDRAADLHRRRRALVLQKGVALRPGPHLPGGAAMITGNTMDHIDRACEEARRVERARLRPLLERCRDFAMAIAILPGDEFTGAAARRLFADLRSELGKEG